MIVMSDAIAHNFEHDGALLFGVAVSTAVVKICSCRQAFRAADTKFRYEFMNLSSWLMAARPRTLSLSITPVVVGTALAWAVERQVHGLPVLAALIGSMCIQLGTNLHNDAVDSERGGDGPDRVGPPRVTAWAC